MSIKKLFGSTDKANNYLSDTDQKDAFASVESSRNLKEIEEIQAHHIPHIDYSKPANFVKYGSARLYYKTALKRISDYYPYDGSSAEINSFYNKSLDIEKYILNNLYPRTNGYAIFSADGWGSKASNWSVHRQDGYGIPATPEAIIVQGGPNAATGELKDLIPTSKNNKYQYSNVYDEDIYRTAGLPSDYGKGTRESNMRANFDDGVTVEFWMKTGSFTDGTGTETLKQVVFDLWNRKDPNTGAGFEKEYGRITVELTGVVQNDIDYSDPNSYWSDSPFLVTVQSGSVTGSYQQTIGKNITTSSMGEWNHYAITLFNSGSGFMADFHVNGHLSERKTLNASQTLNEIAPKNMVARIGSLLTASCGALENPGPIARFGSIDGGKLNGSIDEFRYWKSARTHEEIGKNWFAQVAGGANTDISNAELGIYFKFNEGITGDASLDNTVLDYAGRISNGTWYGYTSNSRNTGSAIIEAAAATKEYEDPIIRPEHPDYIALESELSISGENFDINNNNSMLSLLPGWIIEEEENNKDSDLQNICHIVGAYFDKLHMQISEIPKFHYATYPSASQKPAPFAEHFAQSFGLYTPELFIDSTVLEKFADRDEEQLFEASLQDTKNLIYTNLYNNIANIFKSKGTEKAIKNVFRCMGIDEKLIKLVVNSNNQDISLRDNYQQSLINKNCLNFNNSLNSTAVVYQAIDSNNANSLGYLTNPTESSAPSYGCTVESNIVLPYYTRGIGDMDRDYDTVSLFGMYTVDTTSADSKTGADPSFIGGYGIDSTGGDDANFQVYAIKESKDSRNVYFKLSSSNKPIPFPIDVDNVLTSSLFLNAYDNQEWNISVRLKPLKGQLTNLVYGAGGTGYEVIFSGYQTQLGEVINSFSVSSSVSQTTGSLFMLAGKRIYAGANRENLTGRVIDKSDILVNNIRYWSKYLEDSDLIQHTHDIENRGISGSYRPLSPIDTGSVDIINSETLALEWNFTDLTSSRADGTIGYIKDYSSGSTDVRNPHGNKASWLSNLAGYQHTGYGYGFAAESTNIVDKRNFNSYKLVDPERAVSSDMINIYNDEYDSFYRDDNVPNYVYTIEKSFYNIVSEQMMEFFAGIVDFNSLIGAPVNRYRDRYKDIEKLRQTFFKRVKSVSDVEKFVKYYKWFDDSISSIISQLVPESSVFINNSMNVIESHVLERNKYRSKFPTLNFEDPDVEAYMKGFTELRYPWYDGSSTLPSSPRNTGTHKTYWLDRAERDSIEITSGDSTIDTQRNKYKDIINRAPHMTGAYPTLSDASGTLYSSHKYSLNKFARTSKFNMDVPVVRNLTRPIKGGTNFEPEKDLSFAPIALHPAGPVNRENGIFVPRNVLLGMTKEMVETQNIVDPTRPPEFISKEKRVFKVQHGRDWEDGIGYKNVKSSIGFPFNVLSSSVKTGYNKSVIDNVTGGIEITNLHNDTYGDDKEVPMQGTFTERVVGGHQSRHIAINTGTDNWKSRPEAWKILLGTCEANPSGAIGMVGPDYPWPEANDEGQTPYPLTASQKAVFYRDFVAKRPVNIRNINTMDVPRSTTVPGNYENNYEVVNSFGAHANPRRFIDNQPTPPERAFRNNVTGATQIRTFLDTRRTDESHSELMPEYSTEYLQITSSENKTVIATRFSNPGGPETMTRGYLDFRSAEMSVYNAFNYRNLSIIKHSQGPSGTLPEPPGDGPTTTRVYDIHAKDYGLRSHRARHTARFGRDSLFVTSSDNLPGAQYDQLPGFHKIHRNNVSRLKIVDQLNAELSGIYLNNTASILWPDPSQNAGNCLVVQATSSDGQNAANALIFDNNLVGAANEFPVWTFSAWVNPSASNAPRTIWDAGKTSVGNGSAHTITIEGDETLRYQAKTSLAAGGGNERFTFWETNTNTISNGSWNHIVVSVSGTIGGLSNSLKPTLYINGVSMSWDGATSPSLTPYDNLPNARTAHSNFRSHTGWSQTPPVVIGGDWQSANYKEYYGALDEISIWNTQLTDQEVAQVYNSGAPCNLTHSSSPQSVYLKAWWRLGEGDAAVSGDPSGKIMDSNNIIRDIVGSASLCPTALSGSNMNLYIVPSSLAGCDERVTIYSETVTHVSSSLYDNDHIQHPIPRTDIQYKWIRDSISDPDNTRYYEFQKTTNSSRMPYFSNSAGYTPYYNFITESQAAHNQNISPGGWKQPILRLNTLILDPLTENSNTIGFAADTDVSNYINTELNPGIGSTNYLNMLLAHRSVPYGWTWQKTRNYNNPIIIDERKKSVLSAITSSNKRLQHFRMSAVSTRGRTALINFDAPIGKKGNTAIGAKNNMTLKVTDNNERIMFNEAAFNSYINNNVITEPTPLTQIIRLGNNSKNKFKLKWILYSQNLFPSERNEYMSGTYKRNGYDNGYWRVTGSERISLGATQSGSFSYNIFSSSIGRSSWPLDEPENFLTRTRILGPDLDGGLSMQKNGNAGELQNVHFSYVSCSLVGGNLQLSKVSELWPAALYARKHMLAAPRSVVSPSGIENNIGMPGSDGVNFSKRYSVEIYAGEAAWDAPRNAGVVRMGYSSENSNKGTKISSYQVTSSEPWFATYDDFSYEMGLIAKDYSVVPEFRISEHIEDYMKHGPFDATKNDIFEVPGVSGSANSSTGSFYKDYSNSEFMKDFLRVKSESFLEAKEIRLVCSAAIRLNPYKGFYPAQRTLDLVGQFSSSYANSITAVWELNGAKKPLNVDRALQARGSTIRPLMQALYSPGLMYNTIKSGIAVDYPIVNDKSKIERSQYGRPSAGPMQSLKQSDDNYAILPANINSNSPVSGYNGGSWFDVRLPFETLLQPKNHINGLKFLDIEPHPSASLSPANVTTSFNSQGGDEMYEMMASNFFGEVPNFFLKDSSFTRIESGIIPDDLSFKDGEVYGARLKIRRSTTGTRTYSYDSGSTGDGTNFAPFGAKAFYDQKTAGGGDTNAWYPVPQDPQNARMDPIAPFRETFTMYSRPSAFGPPISGRPPSGSNGDRPTWFLSASLSGTMDCFNGYNWAYTPPYYHGESWVDFIFRPTPGTTYNLQSILANIKTRYWRVDPGMESTAVNAGQNRSPALVFGGNYLSGDDWAQFQPIYAGANINDNAMQLSASFNLFGIERVAKETSDRFGKKLTEENTTTGMKWVIQPKFETPMLNFNDTGVNAISASLGNKSIPLYGSGSVPNGMWHQFGNIPDKPNVGVFMEMGDIPTQWLKYHYDVNSTGSIYNNFDAPNSGSQAARQIKSLSNLLGFEQRANTRRLGEIAEQRTIREAIVAIPYVIEELENFEPPFGDRKDPECGSRDVSQMSRKRLISIPKKRFKAALQETDGTLTGDSLSTAGESIRKLMQKMERYILPPQFDFIQHSNIDPFVMYMFEFEYKFDKDDLSYIWQNLAPRNYKKLTFEAQSISHELMDMELLNENSLFDNEHMRWMVFKVKQKSQSGYYDHVVSQIGDVNMSKNGKISKNQNTTNSSLQYNWPYDYLSFVELIKFDVDVLFKEPKDNNDNGKGSK